MTISFLRRIVAVVCLGSVAGMIALSIANNIGGALTAGIIGAVAMLCLITGNAIHLGENGGGAQVALEAELQARVDDLVRAGADHDEAQRVIAKAIRFGAGYRNASEAGCTSHSKA